MITVTCIQKFRDKNNNITGYKLRDKSGNIINVTPEKLKAAILGNKIKEFVMSINRTAIEE